MCGSKYCLPVMATTFPSNRFRQSEPMLGPLNHIRKKCVRNRMITTPAITEPTVIPIIASVPKPCTILHLFLLLKLEKCMSHILTERCALVRVSGGTDAFRLVREPSAHRSKPATHAAHFEFYLAHLMP